MTVTGSTAQVFDATHNPGLVSVRTVAQQMVQTSYEKSGLDLMDYAQLVVAYAESTEEQNRRAAIKRRTNILRDAWGPLLLASFENWVTPEVLKATIGANKDHIDLSRNPAKHIWKELSVSYKGAPLRTTARKSDITAFNKLIKYTKYNLFWAQVELLMVCANEALIWPEVITVRDEKKIKLRVATGDSVTLIGCEDDPTEIEAVLLIGDKTRLGERPRRVYTLWTDKWHARFVRDEYGALEPTGQISEETGYTNPFGRLIHQLVRLQPWSDVMWDITSGEDVVDLTLRSGEERLFYRYLQKMSGFKQGVVTGHADDEMPQQLMDPAALIKIPGEVNFTLVDWQVDLRQRQECTDNDELRAAAQHGINPERYKRSGNYAGASQARVAERGLSEARLQHVPILAVAEMEFARDLCLVAGRSGVDGVPSDDIEVEVEHAQLAYPEDPREQLAVEKEEIAMFVSSPQDAIARRHPTWTKKQIDEYLKRTAENIAFVQKMKVEHNVPNDPAKESLAAEDNGRLGPAVRDGKIEATKTPSGPQPENE
ncbi:MAG: hypothetical protein GY835_24020 [bacterium]|nr:hypothetical protein [bacterium]